MIDLVTVPPGECVVGSAGDDRFATDTERPAHKVRFEAPFGLGRFPVTVQAFSRFRPEHGGGEDPDWPVVNVGWHDCLAYCAWLGTAVSARVRLPTEAEWEFACRAGSSGPFSFGSSLSPDQANYLYDETGTAVGPGSRTAVGSYPLNAFGLGDMHGNVCEWVQDTWTPGYAERDRAAPNSGSAPPPRVIRGGAWDYLPRLLRSAWRDSLPPSTRRDNVGFRVAVDLE